LRASGFKVHEICTMIHFSEIYFKGTLILLCALSFSCTNKRSTSSYQGECFIVVSQSGLPQKLSDGTKTIELQRENFDIRWWDGYYSFEENLINTMQIAVDTNAAIFNGIKPGVRIDETTCFAPGTGLAGPHAKPYESVILSSDSHHYIFFENDEKRRANVITQSGDIYHLNWPVEKIYLNDKDQSISNFQGEYLYLVVFQNHNQNEVIDNNELLLLTIKFVD
jgi:hypothetical protein